MKDERKEECAEVWLYELLMSVVVDVDALVVVARATGTPCIRCG
jgi:hypothetical protein